MGKKLGTDKCFAGCQVHPCRCTRGVVPVSRGCRERAGHRDRHWSWEPDQRDPGQRLPRAPERLRDSGFANLLGRVPKFPVARALSG